MANNITDEEITRLAREYAEEVCDHMEDDFIKDEAIRDNELSFMMVVNTLSQRYCIVEKSRVKEEYKTSKHYFEHTDSSNPTQKQYFWGRMCSVETLFGDALKEEGGENE